MKKVIISIIVILILICIAILSLLIGTGYNMYSEALEEQSIQDKVNSIKSSDSYTSINEMTDTYKNAVIAVSYTHLMDREDKLFLFMRKYLLMLTSAKHMILLTNWSKIFMKNLNVLLLYIWIQSL